MKFLSIFLFLCYLSSNMYAQDTKKKESVSFLVVEEIPIYPGCKGNRKEIEMCFSKGVQSLFANNFNTDLPNQLDMAGGKYRVFIGYKINKNGEIVDVIVRAPHKKIEEEVLRVMSLFPKVVPGKQRGKPIGIKYSIPFTIKVTETQKQKRERKRKRRELENRGS